MDAVSLAVALVLGIAASMVAWFLLQHVLRAKLTIAPQISRLWKDDGTSIYRVKLVNQRKRRSAIDIEVIVDAVLFGRFPRRPRTQQVLKVQTATPSYPVLRAGGNRVIILRLGPLMEKEKLGDAPRGDELHALLSRDSRDYIRVWVICTDGYSGQRRGFTQKFHVKDIVDRFWIANDSVELGAPTKPGSD